MHVQIAFWGQSLISIAKRQPAKNDAPQPRGPRTSSVPRWQAPQDGGPAVRRRKDIEGGGHGRAPMLPASLSSSEEEQWKGNGRKSERKKIARTAWSFSMDDQHEEVARPVIKMAILLLCLFSYLTNS